LLEIEIQFLLNNLSWLSPTCIHAKIGVWIAYIKRQLGIATHVSVINVKNTVAEKKRIIQFSLNNFSLLRTINTKLCVWVDYFKKQVGFATLYKDVCDQVHCWVTVAKVLNNLSLLSPTDTKLCARVPYIKTKLGIATLVEVTVAKIEFRFPLNNFSLFWHIDAELCI
jgi:hypothetical protein